MPMHSLGRKPERFQLHWCMVSEFSILKKTKGEDEEHGLSVKVMFTCISHIV